MNGLVAEALTEWVNALEAELGTGADPSEPVQVRAERTAEADLVVRGLGVRVSAQDGVVRLMGVVQSAAIVKRAEETVRSVAGVRGLDNRLVTGGMLDFD